MNPLFISQETWLLYKWNVHYVREFDALFWYIAKNTNPAGAEQAEVGGALEGGNALCESVKVLPILFSSNLNLIYPSINSSLCCQCTLTELRWLEWGWIGGGGRDSQPTGERVAVWTQGGGVRPHESLITSAVWKLFLGLKQLLWRPIGPNGSEWYRFRIHKRLEKSVSAHRLQRTCCETHSDHCGEP